MIADKNLFSHINMGVTEFCKSYGKEAWFVKFDEIVLVANIFSPVKIETWLHTKVTSKLVVQK